MERSIQLIRSPLLRLKERRRCRVMLDSVPMFWILLWGISSLSVLGQGDSWILRKFIPPQGTNFEEVRDIVVTDEGSIWFSSWGNGIARLNESDWVSYSSSSGHLPSDFVPTLFWDAEEHWMWAGTDEGLVVFDSDQAVPVSLPVEFFGDEFEITFVFRFSDGELWIGSRMGAVIGAHPSLSADGKRIVLGNVREVLVAGGDPGFVVRGILEGQDGSRWVARNRSGVMQLQEGAWVEHSPARIGVDRSDGLFEAADGGIWVSGSEQPSGFDGERWTVVGHSVETKFFSEASDGKFYLGSSTGQIFSSESSQTTGRQIRSWNNVVTTRVRVVRVFNDFLLWVGTKEGILLGTRPRWRERGLNELDSLDSEGGGFYTSETQWPISIRGNGSVVEFQSETNEWQAIVTLPIQDIQSPIIAAPRGGICWVRNGNELFAVDLNGGRIDQQISIPEGFRLTGLLADADGTLFIVGESGAYSLENETWVPAFEDQLIHSINLAKNGDVLVALSNDIQRWRNYQLDDTLMGTNRNPNHPLTFVAESRDGRILAGTRGLGLKVFGAGQEESLTVKDSLLSSRILSACQDRNGSLWVGFDNLGVAVRSRNRWVNYSADDGLEAGEIYFIGEDPAGDVWAAMDDASLFRFEGDSTAPDTWISEAAAVVGPGEIAVFGFEGYDAWGHTTEAELEFSWRLVRLEGEKELPGTWSETTRSRAVSIKQGMDPGRYIFEVRAEDRDFNFDRSPAQHRFDVLPPIWMRTAFILPVGFFATIAVFLAFRLASKHSDLRKHRDHLNEEVRKRTVELESVNDSLRAEKERLFVTLRSIGEGIIVTNVDGEIVLFNQAAEGLLGLVEEEAVGHGFNDLVHLRGFGSGGNIPSPPDTAIAEQRVVTAKGDVVLVKNDQSTIEVSYSCAPITDADTQVIGCVFAVRDVSHLRQLEEETSKASRLESLGLLAGGIAHDFNNFLTTIMGNISIAKLGDDVSSELREILQESEAASLRASELTQQLLTFSKGGAPVKKKTSISEAIRHSVEFTLRGTTIKPVFEICPHLKAVDVDLGQLTQLLQNLTINALQAMPSGGGLSIVASNVTRIVEGQSLPFVQIQVVDQGSGISKDVIGRVFDPYFSTKKKGNGLGLSVCYSIMKRHDGYIDIDSPVGQGTTVSLLFPAREDSDFTTHPDVVNKPTGEKESSRLKVLVMDDEEPIRDLLSRILKRLGHRSELARNGDLAIDAYRSALNTDHAFDLVILDLTVPGGMGGKECMKRLLEIDGEAIGLASSGYSEDPVLSSYRDFGFSGVLKKPYGVQALRDALSDAVKLKP